MGDEAITLRSVLEEFIAADVVERVAAESASANLHLALHAVRSGVVGQDELADRLAARAQTVVVDVRAGEIDPEVLRRIPRRVARRCLAVPIGRDGDALHVAFADPLDHEALREIRGLLGVEVRVFVAPVGDIERALRRPLSTPGRPGELPEEPTLQIEQALRSDPPSELTPLATAPLYRPSAEASLAQRHEALVLALVEAGAITYEGYHAVLQRLLGDDPEAPK